MESMAALAPEKPDLGAALYQATTSQAAEKLAERVSRSRFVSGHDF
jgi:hypothetical protein